MSELKGKIDFLVLVTATEANPNGDPLNGNRPRENFEGYGEISDVCIKRKIRNRWQDMGQRIFVQSDERADDSFGSLKERADGCAALKAEIDKKGKADRDKCAEIACREWLDVRSFGQVFAFKGTDVSLGIRGPVSIHQAVSASPVEIISMQITKSVNSEDKKGRASDTMGTKHRIGFGLYTIKGSVNVQLAEKTGFSQEDAELLKEALKTLFENDASSARPEGSMEVCRLYWWQHSEKTPAVSTAKIHRSVKIEQNVDRPKKFSDYTITLEPLDGVKPEVFDFV
ncbi:MAG: type I-C CRISPR-associated protein Cas7/Csd2 [Eubacteriales bacterium]|nr:type I-C CRISPR-associated protein Cas7/Csd2 [Eubacteriales bacterium]